MKLFRLVTTLLLLALIVVFVRQNLTTFQTVLPFSFNLYIREQVQWTHQLATLLGLSGFLGFLIGVGLMLRPYRKMRRASRQKDEAELQALATRPLIVKGKTAGPSGPREPAKPVAQPAPTAPQNPPDPA